MTEDDDILTGPVPEPDAEPTAAERAHARTFADIVDKTLSGRTPAAMSADDRALLEVATVIRAANGGLELAATKKRSLIEDVLRQAVSGGTAGAGTSMSGATPISRARSRRWAPWAIAGASTMVAAAAIVMLWVRTPQRVTTTVTRVETPTSWTSRPADALIGEIPKHRNDDATARIDDIFADRLEGFRERRLDKIKPRRSGAKP